MFLTYIVTPVLLLIVLLVVVYVILRNLPPVAEVVFSKNNDFQPHIDVDSIITDEVRNVSELFVKRVQKNASRGCYYEKSKEGIWEKTTWQEFYDRSAEIANGLVEVGIKPGDKVSILGRTCGRWCELDMATHLVGAVGIGIYPKQSKEKLHYQLEHSDTKITFADSASEVEEILNACDGLDMIVVPWDEKLGQALKDTETRAKVVPYSVFQKEKISDEKRDELVATRDYHDTAIMVYTSGTTGKPKGVMLSHKNICEFCKEFPHPFRAFQDELTFSFLPMAHIAERVISFYGRLSYGICACFCSSYPKLMKEMDEVRPTIFGSVPRIFEKAYSQIFMAVGKLPTPIQTIFNTAVSWGVERFRYENANQPVPLLVKIKSDIADTFLLQFVRRFFLGGRCAHFITGAAPIARDIIEFFWACKLPIYEVYGMSEGTAATHLNHDDWGMRIGTVGKPIPKVETKIADDGEILIRCPWVFKGYYKNEEASKEAVTEEGFLKTGDIGEIDSDGFLKITDRKKHIIITSGGKNIAPASIENAIKAEDPLISQVVAFGDKQPYITALIAPGPLETIDFGVTLGLFTKEVYKSHFKELMKDPTARSKKLEEDMAKVTSHEKFIEKIKDAVAAGNKRLMHVEQVKAFFILDRDLSQEHGEMTPTMKVKRKVLMEKFSKEVERLYEDPKFGVRFTKK